MNMLTMTDAAKRQLSEILRAESRDNAALRVAIKGRGFGPGGFDYELQFVPTDSKTEGDQVFDQGAFCVYVDAGSVPKLAGASIDYVDEDGDTGFQIENPNSAWDDPLAASVQRVLDTKINPAVSSHGGRVMLLDVKDGTAYVELAGGCQGCGMAEATLKQGIEVMIQREVPEISKVLDRTDHASGTNPYYVANA
jgi:Fe/S biogenesis protein NfuA